MHKRILQSILIVLLFVAPVAAAAEICTGFGPQTPRDIDSPVGENPVVFSPAPDFSRMNLCDIHFHKQAEHKAADFSLPAIGGDYGGFRCNATGELTLAELRPVNENHCTNVAPGDTIEVHWVYTSCDVDPAPGLASCLAPESCLNPTLRVEAQVFLLVNDDSAGDFDGFDYAGQVDGYHQARALPSATGQPVEFLGSTTGATFNAEVCSPLQVSWSVRPQCAKLDIGTLSDWCQSNRFNENTGGTVRELVRDPRLLSRIDDR